MFLRNLSNVYSLVASATGYKNRNLTSADIPLTNASGTIPGPLNAQMYVPYTAPNITAVGAGGGPVFVSPGLNLNMTAANAPAPVNLTAMNLTVPGSQPSPTAPAAPKSSPNSAAVGREVIAGGAAVLGVLFGYTVLLT